MGIMDSAKNAASNIDKDKANDAIDKGQERVSNEELNQRIDDAQDKFGGEGKDAEQNFGGETTEGASEEER